mgnify:CR=1 FL=1
MLVVETSALVAILEREPETSRFAALIDLSDRAVMIAPAVLEASIVLSRRHGEKAVDVLFTFLDQSGIEVVPCDAALARAASAAFSSSMVKAAIQLV